MKKLVLHSGGQDSLAMMLECIEKNGVENIISLGFNYGQRHFVQENFTAFSFCEKYGIKRIVLDVPISQIGGCSLIDKSIPVTTDMSKQRSTVVPQRNAIFLIFAAAIAQENDCDEIWHGAVKEDYEAYRDCRPMFFRLVEAAIQAGRTNPIKGPEDIMDDMINIWSKAIELPRKLDIHIKTPLINDKKEDTVKKIIAKYGVDIYRYSYSCYNGTVPQCGKCPACQERKHAFEVCGVEDPVK